MSVHETFATFPDTRSRHQRAVAEAIHDAVEAMTAGRTRFADLPPTQRQALLDDAARAIAGRVGWMTSAARERAADAVMLDDKFDGLDVFVLEACRVAMALYARHYEQTLLQIAHEHEAGRC